MSDYDQHTLRHIAIGNLKLFDRLDVLEDKLLSIESLLQSKADSEQALIKISEAARLAYKSPCTIHGWIEKGYLKVVEENPRRLDRQVFMRFLNGLKNKQGRQES